MRLTLEEELELMAVGKRLEYIETLIQARTKFFTEHLYSLQECIDQLEARIKELEAGIETKSTD